MALGTVILVDKSTFGNRRMRIYDIQLSTGANWTAAGETLTPRMVGMSVIFGANVLGPATNGTPLSFQVGYNYTTQKLIAFGQNATPGPAVGQPVVTGNTALSGYTVRIQFIGR